MSRAIVQTVTLTDGATKVFVLDRKQLPDGVKLYNVIKWGEPLPKGTTPGPEHIHIVKLIATADGTEANGERIKMTMNEAHKMKHFWDEAKDGPRPKRSRPAKKDAATTTTEATPTAVPKKKKKAPATAAPAAEVEKSEMQKAVENVKFMQKTLNTALQSIEKSLGPQKKKTKTVSGSK